MICPSLPGLVRGNGSCKTCPQKAVSAQRCSFPWEQAIVAQHASSEVDWVQLSRRSLIERARGMAPIRRGVQLEQAWPKPEPALQAAHMQN